MERNDNCSLECLLHRLFLTSPSLSNHGACIRWYWKGSVHRFLLSKNTLTTKPFHEAEDSHATPMALLSFFRLWAGAQTKYSRSSMASASNSDGKDKDTDYKNQELYFNLWWRQLFSLSLSFENVAHGKNWRSPNAKTVEDIRHRGQGQSPTIRSLVPTKQ